MWQRVQEQARDHLFTSQSLVQGFQEELQTAQYHRKDIRLENTLERLACLFKRLFTLELDQT